MRSGSRCSITTATTSLSGAELARGSVSDVYPPTTTFSDRHTVTLGGKRVTMIHLGTAHADDSSVLHFPDERAVFSADIVQVRRLPGGLAPTVGAWIDALRTVNALDFDHALTGHALAGTKKDAADLLRYLEEHLDRRRGRHRGGPEPRRNPEDAHARRLQELGAVGYEPGGAHEKDGNCRIERYKILTLFT